MSLFFNMHVISVNVRVKVFQWGFFHLIESRQEASVNVLHLNIFI